jgi:hypothetical protein
MFLKLIRNLKLNMTDNGSVGVKNMIKHYGKNNQLPMNVTSA